MINVPITLFPEFLYIQNFQMYKNFGNKEILEILKKLQIKPEASSLLAQQ